MKSMIALIALLSAFSAFSQEGTEVGNCKVLAANERDNNGSACTNGTAGIALDGVLLQGCYENEFQAVKEMNKIKSCQKSITNGGCKLWTPGTRDSAGHSCFPQSYIPVTYNGFQINTTSCFKNIDNAIKEIETNPICEKNDNISDFAIAYPNRADSAGYVCKDAFGVMYKGRMATRECFLTIEKAMKNMEKLSNEI